MSANGVCDEYDPRFRPWYTIAASGSKNVILLLDSTAHMGQGDKLGIAKTVAKNIVSSLSQSDSIGILAFHNTV